MKEGGIISVRARAVGEGQGIFLESNQEEIKICDLEGGRGGVSVTCKRVIWRELQTGLEYNT